MTNRKQIYRGRGLSIDLICHLITRFR